MSASCLASSVPPRPEPSCHPGRVTSDDSGGRSGHAGAKGWTVWRQDDNGNRYVVSRHDTQAEAESVAAEMEARGHKQVYWVAGPE